MAVKYPYRIVAIPSLTSNDKADSITTALAEKYQTLRLDSLKTNPEAFGSSYEFEVEMPLERTIERLRNDKALQLIAVRILAPEETSYAAADDVDILLASEWVGMIVLLGPQETNPTASAPMATSDPFARMTAEKAAREEAANPTSARLHYTINAMFVSPVARRGGLGIALLRAAFQSAEDACRKYDRPGAVVDLAVNFENDDARKLYEKAGFRVVCEERYTQRARLVDGEMRALEKRAWKMEAELPLQSR